MLFFDLRLTFASTEMVRINSATMSRRYVKFILIVVGCPGSGSELSGVVWMTEAGSGNHP